MYSSSVLPRRCVIAVMSLTEWLVVKALIELNCWPLNACAGRHSFPFAHVGIVWQMAVRNERKKQHYMLYQVMYKLLRDYICFSPSVLV